jgi:hypothetical protein
MSYTEDVMFWAVEYLLIRPRKFTRAHIEDKVIKYYEDQE